MQTPVTGAPRALLRVEAVAVLGASLIAYREIGASWPLFALLLLVPDVALVGYLGGPRIGAIAYNALHTYAGPAALAALCYVDVVPDGWAIVLIWVAHIAMDRGLGLGLKFASAFRDTHLGTVGRVTPTG
jgi:hypothetical protein